MNNKQNLLTDALLSQAEEILEGSSFLTSDLKQELDRRMEKYRLGESKLFTWVTCLPFFIFFVRRELFV